MKLLLYCTKSKPRLFFDKLKQIFSLGKIKSNNDLNGKVVAECDFEVEKITTFKEYTSYEEYDIGYQTGKIDCERLLQETCLNNQQLDDYLLGENGYAIYIKNLTIFDKPKELSDYYSQGQVDWIEETELYRLKNGITTAPQNMCYAYKYSYSKAKLEKYILISIQPQWICKILNGEKTIEVRKKVLKEMLG